MGCKVVLKALIFAISSGAIGISWEQDQIIRA
jgi:hypothetical protein